MLSILAKPTKKPDGSRIGDTHIYRWKEEFKVKLAYESENITATPDNPLEVWQQSCQEAMIIHNGKMHSPPPVQRDLFL
jgi:hypothetical protein